MIVMCIPLIIEMKYIIQNKIFIINLNKVNFYILCDKFSVLNKLLFLLFFQKIGSIF
jgi:hypothetical protein